MQGGTLWVMFSHLDSWVPFLSHTTPCTQTLILSLGCGTGHTFPLFISQEGTARSREIANMGKREKLKISSKALIQATSGHMVCYRMGWYIFIIIEFCVG